MAKPLPSPTSMRMRAAVLVRMPGIETSDRSMASSRDWRWGGEVRVLVVVLACDEAVVELAEEPVEEVAQGRCVPVPDTPAAIIVAAG
ncbi:hypothetical protein, partial [Streptomyces sp. NRRL F-2664]|uniref:hypothetical protein n=1 Tax=Streptomyces sp. NRRL F-2664 TaxID=1463842 RepID=UPI003B63724A